MRIFLIIQLILYFLYKFFFRECRQSVRRVECRGGLVFRRVSSCGGCVGTGGRGGRLVAGGAGALIVGGRSAGRHTGGPRARFAIDMAAAGRGRLPKDGISGVNLSAARFANVRPARLHVFPAFGGALAALLPYRAGFVSVPGHWFTLCFAAGPAFQAGRAVIG